MVNNCFLCLKICKTRRCKTCLLVSHNTCWINFKNKCETSDNCPQCRTLLNTKLHNTRSKQLDKKGFISIISKCIQLNRTSTSSFVKIKQTIKIYTVISENKWFLDSNKEFNDVAKNKLLSFIHENNWYEGIKLYERIWN